MLIDLKPLIKKAKNLTPIAESLVAYCGWKGSSYGAGLVWKNKEGKCLEKYFSTNYFTLDNDDDIYIIHSFAFKKARTLVLDTEKQLIIMDGFIAIDVGPRC